MKRTLAKRVLTLALALVLVVALGVPALGAQTMLSNQNLEVNGKGVEVEKYNIDGYNYFKLRDLAELLNGTESQFDVDYNESTKEMIVTTGVPYTHKNGTELKTGKDNSASAKPTTQKLVIDGETVDDLTIYNIGDNNFFKLRELGQAVHFYVHYDEATRTMLVEEQDEEEDWETGDASLDNIRNQDGIGKIELLVVSFGTSFNESRVKDIGGIEAAMEKAFPGYSVRRGFTANIIIDHVYAREDMLIDDVDAALKRAIDNGVEILLVQPTHLMHGFEYEELREKLAPYADSFEQVVVSEPLLTSDEDFDTVIATITADTAKYLDGETAICFMGHGTEHPANKTYATMKQKLTEQGYKDYFVGTVEAEPTFDDVVQAVKAAGYKKVILEPLMIVAGDHAHNDMDDGDDPESWRSLFEAEGIQVTSILEGLGRKPAIQQLLVDHMKEAASEALDEDYTTGDASRDDPRNADGIGTKELLVLSFGTSYNDSRVATIGAIEAAMEKAFPELSVRRGFTANIVIDHVKERDGEVIDDINEALDRAVKNGVQELYVQPTHLMSGIEYDEIVEKLAKYSDSMTIKIGKPLCDSDKDKKIVMSAIVEATKQYDDGKTAIVFMGHGTEHAANALYANMQKLLTDNGYTNYFVGTVEAEPSVEDVIALVKAGGYERVILRPLMIVAGDHAHNDMADPEDEESWYSQFVAAGFAEDKVIPVLEGLGQLTAIQDLLVAHAKVMIAEDEVAAPTSRKQEASSYESLVQAGMTAVTGDQLADGEYAVKVDHTGMFAINEDATLKVKDGKMTVVITTTSEKQNWVFAGKGSDLAAAKDSDLIPLENMTFSIPVEALDADTVICTYSVSKEGWYERLILVRADSLPAGAVSLGTDPASLSLKDGEYTVAVTLGGGSGKTSVTSPAKLVVKGGKLTATIEWSSKNYDYMKIGDTQYSPVNKDGENSTFELPVSALDTNLAVIAHTTAMGGKEIEYTLNFDSASIK